MGVPGSDTVGAGATTVNASRARTSTPPNWTATSTALGRPSTTGTTTSSTRWSPASEARTGGPSTSRPSMNTRPSRSSSAWSKYVPASSTPTVSPGRA
ncbi:hypothetical protein ACFWWC_39605 [Streptomyces sp. NPDC058642]|uniref:hypothetical protein n=1 Tax=Streptomyces sp. NPDC058642 TaxID=3346572 RepID=UPI003668B5C4